MRFLVDNQLPRALARFIQSEFGCLAEHVADIGLRDSTDAEIWAYATEAGAILISKGEDFVPMVVRSPMTRLDLGTDRELPSYLAARRLPASLAPYYRATGEQ